MMTEMKPRDGGHHRAEKGISKRRERRRKEEMEPLASSETDDSSPECDKISNLSKEEGKKLKKVFKCFFGRLCHTISDPVEIAAQLQVKGLITQSMMEDMITSPESHKEKGHLFSSCTRQKSEVTS
jgi:hypothetical protein